MRIFDVPFKTISSLLFNKEGSVLVAAVGGDYLIDWDFARSMFEPDVVFNKGLTSPWFAQSANLVDRGNVSIMVLGMGANNSSEPSDLGQPCLDIEEIRAEGRREIANDAKCARSVGPEDRMPMLGWNTIATDANGSIIAAANQFSNKGVVIERGEASFERREDVSMPGGFSAAGISEDGQNIG